MESKASVFGEDWEDAAEKFLGVPEDDMLRKTINESSEPVDGRPRPIKAQRRHLV